MSKRHRSKREDGVELGRGFLGMMPCGRYGKNLWRRLRRKLAKEECVHEMDEDNQVWVSAGDARLRTDHLGDARVEEALADQGRCLRCEQGCRRVYHAKHDHWTHPWIPRLGLSFICTRNEDAKE